MCFVSTARIRRASKRVGKQKRPLEAAPCAGPVCRSSVDDLAGTAQPSRRLVLLELTVTPHWLPRVRSEVRGGRLPVCRAGQVIVVSAL